MIPRAEQQGWVIETFADSEHTLSAHTCYTATHQYTVWLQPYLTLQGSKEKRLTGDEHMEVVEEFCAAAQHCFPNCLIQFEDFQTNQAFAILEKMRNKYLCFNDDIQGTGGVVTAGCVSMLQPACLFVMMSAAQLDRCGGLTDSTHDNCKFAMDFSFHILHGQGMHHFLQLQEAVFQRPQLGLC